MSKMVNIIKNSKLWTILLTFVLAAGLIIGIFFGLNNSPVMKDSTTLTVSANRYAGVTYADEIQEECKKAFENEGLKYSYKMDGETTGDSVEFVYVFDKDASVDKAKASLQETFSAKTADDGAWAGSFIDVSTANEKVESVMSEGYTLRGAIAAVAIVALAVIYVTIRFKGYAGLLVGGAFALTTFLTTALVAICRVPVTLSVSYVVILSGILAMVMTLFTLNNIRENKTEATAEEFAKSIAVKEIVILAISLAVALLALLIAGLIANIGLTWFALAGVIGVLSATAIGLVYAPSIYLPMKKIADENSANKDKRYVGAKSKED